MTPMRKHLLDMVVEPDAYDRRPGELLPLQLAAARELVAERRSQISVLRRRADETGVGDIKALADLVPLLFAHSVYKSYPTAFIEQGRWDRMLQWLQTLSVEKVTDTDVAGVRDVDEWIERLGTRGHRLLATSGTSGKCSFLNATEGDYQLKLRHFAHTLGWPVLKPSRDRIVFQLFPKFGPNSGIEAGRIGAEVWGRPGATHFLTDEPLKIVEVSAMAAMRKRIAEGSATPSEIAAYEAQVAERAARGRSSLNALIDKILESRHEPMVMAGMWAQHLAIIERARALGVPDGDFHPESYISAGGGVKNVALPEDYKARVERFYGKVHRGGAYGMTEMALLLPVCPARRYHCPPGLILLILDGPGEKLLNPPGNVGGLVEGRFAFLDLLYDGRWGGLITGDRVTVDFGERCPCGRFGPTLLDNIARYAQVGEDDHIGCAGTIDSYVNGALST
jgi:hypothetical protein